MTKFLVVFAMLAALASVPALAVNSVIVPEITTLEPNDVKVVQYCVSHNGAPLAGTAVSVHNICKDHDGVIGCQSPPDNPGTTELAVVALDAVTAADGCGDVQLTTTDASGTFYYSLSGSLGGTEITRETGTALVPEFTTVASAAVLTLAGLLIWRRRPE